MARETMKPITQCDDNACGGASTARCERVWACGRGRTQLCCQMRHHGDRDVELEVLRNGRLYGTYRSVERVAALTFASRLRDSFEGNGWVAA
jgi:hypothetical protein